MCGRLLPIKEVPVSMTIRSGFPAVLPALCLVLIVSCSTTDRAGSPVTLQASQEVCSSSTVQNGETQNNRYLWGFYLIAVDPLSNDWDILPLRQVEDHWNVLKWLEQGPCTKCLRIIDMADSGHGTKLVTVSIMHPFASPNFTGFDVRGIAIFTGSHLFDEAGLNTSDRSMGDPELINADGYTTLYNFTTAGLGPGGLQGYVKGKFASAAAPNSRLNGFKRFESSGAANTRNAFFAGEILAETYDIDMPDSPFLVGYAVDASWAPPTNDPVVDPMTDFPPEANCYEPNEIDVKAVKNYLTESGGILKLEIDVYDHQGPDSYAKPVLECPELFDTPPYVLEESPGVYTTTKFLSNPPVGEYKVLVSVEDNENAGSPSWLDLTGYQVLTVEVQADTGWARTWGGTGLDGAKDVDANIYGICVVGTFEGTVDFDPGPGVEERSSDSGSVDAFACSFDPLGTFQWVATWGGPGTDSAEAVDLPGAAVLIVGSFEDTTDFDPGSGVSEKTSNGGCDACYLRLSTDGSFGSVTTWGGPGDDVAYDVLYCDHEDILIAGSFEGTVDWPDFGPRTSNGGFDAFMWDTNFGKWLLYTVGGPGDDKALGMGRCGSDLLLTGTFSGTADFNPFGVEDHVSNGATDVFLVDYLFPSDNVGVYNWTRTWGGTGADIGSAVCGNATDSYVVGSFRDTVNFNPDSGGTPHNATADGIEDAFVTRFDSGGNHLAVATWGGADAALGDGGHNLCFDSEGHVVAAGWFAGNEFGTASKGKLDCVVAAYSSALDYLWSATWGGTGSEHCSGIAGDLAGRIIASGVYAGTVDFNPGSGVDLHTSNGGISDCFLEQLLTDGSW